MNSGLIVGRLGRIMCGWKRLRAYLQRRGLDSRFFKRKGAKGTQGSQSFYKERYLFSATSRWRDRFCASSGPLRLNISIRLEKPYLLKIQATPKTQCPVSLSRLKFSPPMVIPSSLEKLAWYTTSIARLEISSPKPA